MESWIEVGRVDFKDAIRGLLTRVSAPIFLDAADEDEAAMMEAATDDVGPLALAGGPSPPLRRVDSRRRGWGRAGGRASPRARLRRRGPRVEREVRRVRGDVPLVFELSGERKIVGRSAGCSSTTPCRRAEPGREGSPRARARSGLANHHSGAGSVSRAVGHNQKHVKGLFAVVPVLVRDVRLEQDGVARAEAMTLAADHEIQHPANDDEVLRRAGRMRLRPLHRRRRQMKLVELGEAKLVHREEGPRDERTVVRR